MRQPTQPLVFPRTPSPLQDQCASHQALSPQSTNLLSPTLKHASHPCFILSLHHKPSPGLQQPHFLTSHALCSNRLPPKRHTQGLYFPQPPEEGQQRLMLLREANPPWVSRLWLPSHCQSHSPLQGLLSVLDLQLQFSTQLPPPHLNPSKEELVVLQFPPDGNIRLSFHRELPLRDSFPLPPHSSISNPVKALSSTCHQNPLLSHSLCDLLQVTSLECLPNF